MHLRAEVEALLAFHDRQTRGSSLTPEPVAQTMPEPGRTIDRYRILQRLGSGGMGDVYEAEQQEPIRRRVALKVIKWGMDTADVVARFESERQALALMDHPNIARVLDAGATTEGRPYFVMELVRGVPITDYCDSHRLSPAERLELFGQVCRGVQHAHHKGIIHRDLKPSNILVVAAEHGPSPKIIDFGIAKATSQRLTERTVFTELGQWIGTPEYISPEQTEVTTLDVDTRTDVYSLGVLLYELLVGALPFTAEELRGAGFSEMRRKIQEQDPQRPSTRVSRLGQASAGGAARRRTPPPPLVRLLRGDLDWITMKALEKDRTRRYSSPEELAADIERHLRDEPVLASPPSVAYAVRKFTRRNRGAVIAASLVLAALSIGLVAASVNLVRARRAERLANQQVELLIGLFDALGPEGLTEGAPSAADILATAGERIDSDLANHPLVRARLKSVVGQIYMNIGAHEESRAALEEALALREEHLGEEHPDIAETLQNLGALHDVLGEHEVALRYLRRAAELTETVFGPDHLRTAASLNSLAIGLWRDRDYQEAAPLFERALRIRQKQLGHDHSEVGDTLYMQAVLLRDMGEHQRAATGFQRALAIREAALGPDHPGTAWVLNNYAILLTVRGENDTARAHLERALTIQETTFGRDNFAVIEPLLLLGDLDLQGGDLVGAEQRFARALQVGENHYGGNHYFLGWSLDRLARVAARRSDWPRAQQLAERSLELRERGLGAEHPLVAMSLYWLGVVALGSGEYESAVSHYQRRLEILERAHGGDTTSAPETRVRLALAHARLGNLETAGQLYRDNQDALAKQLLRDRRDAGWHCVVLARVAALLGERGEALAHLRAAREAGFHVAGVLDDPEFSNLRSEAELALNDREPPE